jgi:hypothetical protein
MVSPELVNLGRLKELERDIELVGRNCLPVLLVQKNQGIALFLG